MSWSTLTFIRSCLSLLVAPCLAAAAVSPQIESVPIVDPRALILSSQSGDGKIDQEIARLQTKIRAGRESGPSVIQLGWAFVAKARLTSDPGFYKLAEQCSQLAPEDSDCLLLRGHILHALHRFHDAEVVARKVASSDHFARWQTYALLGDVLMEQGNLSEAIDAYQRMIDIRPCLQTYARVAHLRWLKGDLSGAEDLMRMAVSAGNSRDPEPAAWAYSRLAFYQLQGAKYQSASQSLARAFEFVKDFPAALFLRAKLELESSPQRAVESLRVAITQSPLPEYEWALADASRLAGNRELAAKIERDIFTHGVNEDQRSFALFLAGRNLEPKLALQLAQDELSKRRDVFTYDALAWAELAAGKNLQASRDIERALAEGTIDARLFYHAGKIALAMGDRANAAQWFRRTTAIQQMLLPSEREDVEREAANIRILQAASTTFQPKTLQLAGGSLTRKK